MKIIVTGGAGFIGGNYCHMLAKNHPNYRIICIDRLTYAGNLSTLETIITKKNFKFYKTDITNRGEIDTIFNEEHPDTVINFAAESHVDRSIKNPEKFLSTNVIGTQVLLDASLKYNIKRYHQVSTDEVYGELPINRKDLLFTEDSPIRPLNPYSASKASADLLVQAYYNTYGLPTTISRCSNNYGAFHFPEKLIPLAITNIINNKPICLYGTGENVRDWLDVYDHCAAINLIVHKGIAGEVYNIGGNNERTNLEVVQAILDILEKDYSLIKYIDDRKGHDLRYGINSSKIQNELGWLPTKTFDNGIKDTIKWYLDNKKWWMDILSK